MEILSETEWDVVISGTGLQQSLLALALSRSEKKILHLDGNGYYGGPEAAFSLQEAEEWASKVKSETPFAQFSNGVVLEASISSSKSSASLSFSRAYTLALSPQIIYSRSKILSQLVSSKVYKQLEFQAIGNWWLYSPPSNSTEPTVSGKLKKIPNGREDVFSDRSIDVKAKRSLMKFLKFVVDFENQTDLWHPHGEASLQDFLSSQFQLPPDLRTTILALTLSFDLPTRTTVRYALPRIARHLTSIGVFGPGFGAVIPKWGGGSEIAQVACRAGAVGGGVYVLGTDLKDCDPPICDPIFELPLTSDGVDGETIRTKTVVTSGDWARGNPQSIGLAISKAIVVVNAEFEAMFVNTVEGGPTAAVAVVVFPSYSLNANGEEQVYPVYIMIHSSETGECPTGQCILYASTFGDETSKARLDSAISALIASHSSIDGNQPSDTEIPASVEILFKLSYDQRSPTDQCPIIGEWSSLPSLSLDLAFDDTILDNVEKTWCAIMEKINPANDGGDDSPLGFMQFEDREQARAIGDDED